MTTPPEVIDAIAEEARRAATVYCKANGISRMSVDWSAYRDAILACKMAEWERERWIPVEERLPDVYTWVMVYSDTGEVGDFPYDIGRIINGGWKCLGWDYPVTHWRPLPSPPDNK